MPAPFFGQQPLAAKCGSHAPTQLPLSLNGCPRAPDVASDCLRISLGCYRRKKMMFWDGVLNGRMHRRPGWGLPAYENDDRAGLAARIERRSLRLETLRFPPWSPKLDPEKSHIESFG